MISYPLSLAEQLILFCLDQKKGTTCWRVSSPEIAVAGAVLQDLLIAGRIKLDAKQKVSIYSPKLTGDDLLDEALERQEVKSIGKWISILYRQA